METFDRFGFECTRIGDDGTTQVDLGDAGGQVILAMDDFREAVRDSSDPATFAAKVLELKERAAQDWAKNRGPDSELGRNMESGTPTTDHSSDPN